MAKEPILNNVRFAVIGGGVYLVTDGFKYAIGGTVTDEQIASAVSAYLEENPPSSGLTEEEVSALIQSAIGNTMGGDY